MLTEEEWENRKFVEVNSVKLGRIINEDVWVYIYLNPKNAK